MPADVGSLLGSEVVRFDVASLCRHGQGGVVQEGEAHQCQPYSLQLSGLSFPQPVPALWADIAMEVVKHTCPQTRHPTRKSIPNGSSCGGRLA